MDAIEQRIIKNIDDHREEIIRYARDIELHPEPGFQEVRTAEKTADFLRCCNLPVETGLAHTGVRAHLKENQGINITILAELDAIGCKSHPLADKNTGVAHACGHHAQLSAMAGAVIALCDKEIKDMLGGNVTFLAVPAEEYIDVNKRKQMRKKGIGFPASGKSELIRTGAFDDTDIVMTTHVHMIPCQEPLYLGNASSNGFAAEAVRVCGKAAHAAINPWDGVNALSIATSAIQMMGLMRETFREEDHVRLHNVIRKAGDVINSVPEEALIETKVRAASLEKIREITEMTERAYDGAAYAFGGRIEREVLQGYMPVLYRPADDILIEAAENLKIPYRVAKETDFNNACTDVGDLTHLFPVINFTFGGFQGVLHGADFKIDNEETAYIMPAKMLALSVYKLLKNGAKEAEKIKKTYCPVFQRESYVKYIEEHYHI